MNHICSSIFKKQKGFLSQSNQILIKGRPRIGEHSKYKYKKQSYYQQKCIFRLTNWQIIQNVGITFLGFQDVIKDVFLLAKLILSIGVALFLSDPSTHSFATIVSFCNYAIILCLTWSNWRTHVASRSSGDWCYGWPPIYGFQLNIHKGPFIYYVITFLGFLDPLPPT